MSVVRGVVRSIRGNTFEVSVEGSVYRCRFSGKAKREKTGSNKPATVGDEVEFVPQADYEGVIESVLPRRNQLSRPDPHRRTIEQVIVANVDAILVVYSLYEPDLELLSIDKCTVMAQSCGIPTSIVITKTDLGAMPDLSYYEKHFPLFPVSSRTGEGVEAVRTAIQGKTTVLLGPSGVGKSSLLNTINPALGLKVGEVSMKTEKGKHTTTWAEIIEIEGARVIDTPGLEFFDFWNLTLERLPTCFPELDGHGCRFRDCYHDKEPDCGVHKAREAGQIAESRHESYLTIRRILQEKGVAFTPPRSRGGGR